MTKGKGGFSSKRVIYKYAGLRYNEIKYGNDTISKIMFIYSYKGVLCYIIWYRFQREVHMDYRKAASEVLQAIGGKNNLVSAAHCATRLRLVIGDNTKCNTDALENIDGVKGVFEAAGQLQIIFGTGVVNKVFAEFTALAGIEGGTKEDVKQAAASKQNLFQRAIKTLGDIFVPIIPAIVASGLMMGLLEGLGKVWPELSKSGTFSVISLFSNAAFVFLPILIAVSAARAFGGNMFLGAVIGMIMIHPNLINAWAVAGMQADQIPSASVWFGLFDVNLIGYQGHVIPVVFAVWVMSWIEKKLHKIVPEIIDLFVTPLVTVVVTGYLTLTIIGPIFALLENEVLGAATALIGLPGGIGGLSVGALYAPTVVMGVHHMYNALEAGLLSSTGVNTWMPIATAANVAQGAAALAVAFKAKNRKTKALALPASLSAFLGITEPAIFGVNIRYKKPFIAGCIGGAAGGLVAGLLHVGASAYGITGLFGFLITTSNTAGYALIIVTATAVAFATSWFLYKEEKPKAIPPKKETEIEDVTATADAEPNVAAPMEGTVVALAEVEDETFASEVLGKGVALQPATNTVAAPFDGRVESMFPTGHAVALTSDAGVEILIHIGIDTVAMNGEGFEALVKDGDRVRKGQPLVRFDMDKIRAAGHPLTTMVIVTNSADYAQVNTVAAGTVKAGDALLECR